jgi:hypothetical protein
MRNGPRWPQAGTFPRQPGHDTLCRKRLRLLRRCDAKPCKDPCSVHPLAGGSPVRGPGAGVVPWVRLSRGCFGCGPGLDRDIRLLHPVHVGVSPSGPPGRGDVAGVVRLQVPSRQRGHRQFQAVAPGRGTAGRQSSRCHPPGPTDLPDVPVAGATEVASARLTRRAIATANPALGHWQPNLAMWVTLNLEKAP